MFVKGVDQFLAKRLQFVRSGKCVLSGIQVLVGPVCKLESTEFFNLELQQGQGLGMPLGIPAECGQPCLRLVPALVAVAQRGQRLAMPAGGIQDGSLLVSAQQALVFLLAMDLDQLLADRAQGADRGGRIVDVGAG